MFFRLFFNKWLLNCVFCIVILILMSCQSSQDSNSKTQFSSNVTLKNNNFLVKYAKHFGILHKNSSAHFFVTENFKDTIFYEINKTYTRIAVMGTIPAFQLYMLDAIDKIVAIDDFKYYTNSKIVNKIKQKDIVEIMPNLQWNYELLISIKPQLIVTYSDLRENVNVKQLLQKHSIQHLLYLDYLEEHPLARAEWIKVMGLFTGKYEKAEEIFNDIEQKYLELKQLTDTISKRPKILTEVMYGDVWYIAGNASYISQLIKDSGGKYAFEFHSYNNTRPYSFEYVLKHARDADYWIHLHQFCSLEQMKKENRKYVLFKAFQERKCFNNNKIQNEYGYNDFYESGICQPHLILKDLISILHPDIFSNDTSLNYYYRLQ
ncbi:MAG: hypothetical protein KatS3mg027_2045 [Bacteroidia bacterium]|nr:MAG: hypothetical protein KatS3mg027_2045 [Bacteroidia bacterium]